MSSYIKVCVVTGSRADYDLLYLVMRKLSESPSITMRLLVTGAHLSPDFGLTYKNIEQDGFSIDEKIEILTSSDSDIATSRSAGLGLIKFTDALARLKPDILLVLGDRYEILGVVIAAMFLRIPVAHLHGGESTVGAIDEAIRHSITKMSHLHFVAAESYRRRIIQLGEHPDRIFNVGALAIDNINHTNLLSRREFEDDTKFIFGKKNLLVTYHPVTLEERTEDEYFRNLLLVLDKLTDTHLIFTAANADSGGRVINEMIKSYVGTHSDTAKYFMNMGRERYLSALSHVDGLIGNSSSGIIEAPSFGIGTVNIGDRQTGRIKASSVIDCLSNPESIGAAISKIYDREFQHRLKTVENPFGEGFAAERIVRTIEEYPLQGILKKRFYDIEK